MGISVVYCFHQNNHVARRLFFAKKFTGCSRLPPTAAGCHRTDSRSLASSMRCLSARVYMPITPYVDDFDAKALPNGSLLKVNLTGQVVTPPNRQHFG